MKNCQETTVYVERSGIEQISMLDRFGMRFHLILCAKCRKYVRDSKTLDRLFPQSFDNHSNHQFTVEEKEQMKNLLG